jgi:hypothetical protein
MKACWLSLIALIVGIFLPTTVVGRLVCDAHCASGCTKYGSGHCDLYCQPRATWRLRVFDHTCQPRCGGHCLYCASYYYCDVCWKGYQLVLNSLGQRLCKFVPPVCDIHCADPKNCKNAGECDGPCMTGYQLSSKHCLPKCDTHCIANGCATQGPRHCDATCINNYVNLLSPVYICAGCDPNCSPATPPGCDSTTLGGCTTSCISGYIINSVTGSCDPCSTTCATCGTTGCLTCGPNTVNSLPTCPACDPKCSGGCSTAGYCESGVCVAGYGPTSTTPTKCGACDSNCPSSSGCNTNRAGKCDGPCNTGYVLDTTTNTCAPCQTPNPTSCQTCASPGGICGTCATGFTDPAGSGYCA